MLLFAQIPDAAKAIDKATEAGWTEGALALVFVVCLAILVWLMRTWIGTASERETRMAKRIDDLEAFIRNDLDKQREELKVLVRENTKAWTELSDALKSRPCFWAEQNQANFVEGFREGLIQALEQTLGQDQSRKRPAAQT
jgi:hypothetical protein